MKVNIKGPIISNNDKWIYDWFGMEACCPNDVIAVLEKSAGQHVDVDVNSAGGNVFVGSEIYTALRAYTGSVKIRIVGFAGSAASVISMARESEIAPTAQMMLHCVAMSADGNYQDMNHASDILQNADRSIASAYIAKSGMPEAEVLALMDKETWLTAERAVALKLVDRVMFTDMVAAAPHGGMLPHEVLEKTRAMLMNQKQKNVQKAKSELAFLSLKGRC